MEAGVGGRFDHVVCPALLVELADVLARPKISRLVRRDVADRFSADVRGGARLEPDPAESSPVSRDPEDDYLAALAISVSADALVTGDADLRFGSDQRVRIGALRPFLASLPGPEPA